LRQTFPVPLILSNASRLDNEGIFCHYNYSMRKLFFTTAFFAVTLIGFLLSLIISLTFYHSSTSSLIQQKKSIAYAALPTYENTFSTQIITQDGRIEKIRQFFATYGSPLEPYAEDVVEAADQYGIDYRLIPSIAMQESNLCHKIPKDSNNCWGYGIYGGKVTRFTDYKEGIYTVSKSLGTKYKSNGLITPDQIEAVYTPPSEGSWANGVNHFMDQLK